MKHGARNDIVGVVSEVVEGTLMAQAKVKVSGDFEMSSVMTKDSLQSLGLAAGDQVRVVVKAIHVLLVKE